MTKYITRRTYIIPKKIRGHEAKMHEAEATTEWGRGRGQPLWGRGRDRGHI